MVKTITQGNIRSFFNFQEINTGNIKPGMLLAFRYSSPDGIHDPWPLIYVLSKEGDRVWGLNLHYRFSLIAGLYKYKQMEVQASQKNVRPTTQTPNKEVKQRENPLDKLPKLKKVLAKTKTQVRPSLNKQKQQKQTKPTTPVKKIPINVNLDIFALATKPEYILRNYLFIRMKNVRKLSYKIA